LPPCISCRSVSSGLPPPPPLPADHEHAVNPRAEAARLPPRRRREPSPASTRMRIRKVGASGVPAAPRPSEQ
jgi:hypothetical protein